MARPEFTIDDVFNLLCVGTNISSCFPRQVSLIFGLALIWAGYDDATSSRINPSIIQKVKINILNSKRNIEVDTNPIQKWHKLLLVVKEI